MLTRLAIRDVVLIEALDLDFMEGLGALTGETGAGKSILLDALGLVLGDRAESALVRSGEDRASVSASFEFSALPAAIRQVLDQADLAIEPGEPGKSLLLRSIRHEDADLKMPSKRPKLSAMVIADFEKGVQVIRIIIFFSIPFL